jgi:hypothetical protein
MAQENKRDQLEIGEMAQGEEAAQTEVRKMAQKEDDQEFHNGQTVMGMVNL